MDWENHLEKKSDPKHRKNSKNQSEIAACHSNTRADYAKNILLCQTKIERKSVCHRTFDWFNMFKTLVM